MFRASRALHAAAVKATTGIVGLDVVPNAKEVLTKLYRKTLNDIKVGSGTGLGAPGVYEPLFSHVSLCCRLSRKASLTEQRWRS